MAYSCNACGRYVTSGSCGCYIAPLEILHAPPRRPAPSAREAHRHLADVMRAIPAISSDQPAMIIRLQQQAREDAHAALYAAINAPHEAYDYALDLAVSLHRKHYATDAPGWEPLDDLLGLLTQIDNMLTGLVRSKSEDPA